MKIILALLFTLIVVGSGRKIDTREDDLAAVAAAARARRVSPGAQRNGAAVSADKDQCNGMVYSCKTCDTALICRPTGDNSFSEVKEIKCGGLNPFCDKNSGSCVPEQPADCGDKDDQFICMQKDGKFPDPDCKAFHVCIDYKPYKFTCAVEGESYNPETGKCEASVSCGTFTCGGNHGRKIPHTNKSNFFAYCQESNDKPLVIDVCPGKGYTLNEKTQVCEPNCVEEGLIPDVNDCTKYHKCTWTVLKNGMTYWSVQEQSCPEGQAYSIDDFLCMPKADVKSCNK